MAVSGCHFRQGSVEGSSTCRFLVCSLQTENNFSSSTSKESTNKVASIATPVAENKLARERKRERAELVLNNPADEISHMCTEAAAAGPRRKPQPDTS